MRRSWVSGWAWTACCALALPLLSMAGVPSAAAQESQASGAQATDGRVHYIASCARCHGVDGGGGEGPPLARARLPRAPDDEALIRIMEDGIPGTGMSGAWWLSPSELTQVAGYVRSLAPTRAEEAGQLQGDPSRGRALFEDARCGRCHTIGGFGTARGPDLTAVSARRGPAYLRDAIVDPAAALPRGLTAIASEFVDYLMVRVVDSNGNQIRGMRLNEDTYTIQLKDGRGVIRSFYKPALREIEKEFDASLMESYRDRFSDEELEDLVAYLATLTGTELRGVS